MNMKLTTYTSIYGGKSEAEIDNLIGNQNINVKNLIMDLYSFGLISNSFKTKMLLKYS